MSRVILPIAIAALSVPIDTSAETYLVHPDGTGDFPTIQAAMDAAVDGDVIELADGTFTGDGNRDVDFLGKAVTVCSESRVPETCILDLQGSAADPHRAFALWSGEGRESVIEGITMMNGYGPEYQYIDEDEIWDVRTDGGAILCVHASPKIKRCRFLRNASPLAGGAIASWGGPLVEDCHFEENYASWVSGALSPRVLIEDGSETVISGCTFTRNRTGIYGGAIATSGEIGGPRCVISDCVFLDNEGPRGGAIFAFIIDIEIDRTVFARNLASSGGGALEIVDAHLELTHSTLSENACLSSTSGSGVDVFAQQAPASATIEKTIIAYGLIASGVATRGAFGATVDLDCTTIFGNEGGDWVGAIADQLGVDGNCAAEPFFCPGDDFALAAGSPCLPDQHPDGYVCGLIGVNGSGCAVPTAKVSWGQLKTRFLER